MRTVEENTLQSIADFPDDAMLKDRVAAPLAGLRVQTLREWRTRGVGPRFYRLGGRAVRYKVADLKAWIESQAVEPVRA